MKFIFRVIIVFLIVFNWRVGYVYNSVFVAIILSTIYYLYNKGSIPLTHFFQRYNATILIATTILGAIIFSIPVFHNTEVMSTMEKRVWVQFMMLFAMIYALPLLVEGDEEHAFERVSVIICYAFALQGLIHLTGYIYTPVGNYMFDMKPKELRDVVADPSNHLARFRLYALTGSIFFELPAAYGVACILFFRLILIKGQQYITGWQQYAVMFFMIAGISLSGRTGFVGLGIGIFLWLMFSYQVIVDLFVRNSWKIISGVVVFLIAFNVLLPSSKRQAFQNEVFPFAFEFYYNWRDRGRISTGSTDTNFSEQFYYYLRDQTLLTGHGLERDDLTLAGYSSTDAGYMRSILFGGIPFLLCLIIYQALYFYRPALIANRGGTEDDRKDLWCIVLLFVYMFLLHAKENAMGLVHIVETLCIAAGSGYMIKYYSREESIAE